MQLLTISGFLGAGKTTLVTGLADAAARNGIKPAVLVNEIGDMGIDNQLMVQLDLNVYQILGGCICCTLVKDLPATLENLVADYAPDLVIIEPSGAAKLKSVNQGLKYYGGPPFLSRKSAVVLDCLRFEVLMQSLAPLMTSQIRSAGTILLNKTDLVSSDTLAACRSLAQEIHPGVPIFSLSAKKQVPKSLIRQLLS